MSRRFSSIPRDPRHDDLLNDDGMVVSACSCFGRPPSERKYKKTAQRRSFSTFGRQSSYKEASDGHGKRTSHLFVEEQSLFYFDALEELPDGGVEETYPIITTNYKRPAPYVSLDQPETLLSRKSRRESMIKNLEGGGDGGDNNINCDHNDDNLVVPVVFPTEAQQISKREEALMNRKSVRFAGLMKRSSIQTTQGLERPRIKVEERGYPGGLTLDELEIAKRFNHEIKKERDIEFAEIVFSLREIEEEPYSICRYLRGCQFDFDKAMERLDGQKEMWNRAKKENFYPDLPKALGVPTSVFVSQYPSVMFGNAKNGCPVQYFKAGTVEPEGIYSLTTLDRIESYFWNLFTQKLPKSIKRAQTKDPNIVRVEFISIIDLEGLSSSTLSSDTFSAIKLSSAVGDYFPETLHCSLILNAPSFFSYSWPLIKKLVDPRTAKRIHVFSKKGRGLNRLYELIDRDEIPTDYGGTSKRSIESIVQEQAGLQEMGIKGQLIELMFIKRKGKAKIKKLIRLSDSESMTINVYTRSSSSAEFTITDDNGETVGGEAAAIQVRSLPPPEGQNKDGTPLRLPNCTPIGTIKGPGTFVVEAKDCDDATRELASLSRGYFLVVGDIV